MEKVEFLDDNFSIFNSIREIVESHDFSVFYHREVYAQVSIIKKLVTGHAVISHLTENNDVQLTTEPIYENFEDPIIKLDVCKGDTIVNVIPITHTVYGVFGEMPKKGITIKDIQDYLPSSKEYKLLGFEYDNEERDEWWIRFLKGIWMMTIEKNTNDILK